MLPAFLRRMRTDGQASGVSPSTASGDKREAADCESEIATQYPAPLVIGPASSWSTFGPFRPLGSLPVEAERARMREGQTAALAEFPVEAREVAIHSACTVHLIKPLKAQSPMPITFYLHGGGWAVGRPSDPHKNWCVNLQCGRGVLSLFIDYPRVPEHRFSGPARGIHYGADRGFCNLRSPSAWIETGLP